MSEESKKQNNIHEHILELSTIFDLLARFDYENKKSSEVSTGTVDSAPAVPLLGSEDNK